MNQYYVYILHCRDGSYYTGVTNDYLKRIGEHWHTSDPNSYLYNRRPVKLVYIEEFTSRLDAIQREKQLKGWSRRKKEALLQGDTNLLSWFSKRNAVVLRGPARLPEVRAARVDSRPSPCFRWAETVATPYRVGFQPPGKQGLDTSPRRAASLEGACGAPQHDVSCSP